MKSNKPRLCFIGFGEAGQAIASGLREAGVESIAAWDILFPRDGGARLKQAGEKMGARLASSAAEVASRAPISSPACFSVAPSSRGNRMSHAAMLVTPASRRPDAIACPASPKPMKQRLGLLRRVI